MSTNPGHYTLNIPTKPYLAKFIARKYGDPIILSNHNLFGNIVFSLLQKEICTHFNLKKKHVRFRSFTDHLVCKAPLRYTSSYGVDLTDDHIIQLNRYFENEFEESLHHHVKLSIKQEGRYKGYESALEAFAFDNGIVLEHHIAMDALKKMEYRFRKKKENILANSVHSRFDPSGSKLCA
jgi:hypothetical protein